MTIVVFDRSSPRITSGYVVPTIGTAGPAAARIPDKRTERFLLIVFTELTTHAVG